MAAGSQRFIPKDMLGFYPETPVAYNSSTSPHNPPPPRHSLFHSGGGETTWRKLSDTDYKEPLLIKSPLSPNLNIRLPQQKRSLGDGNPFPPNLLFTVLLLLGTME
ncbi:NADH dehydrogenase [Platysternon megacephalum]|uniref:NADH dehydrogenase n=1 Tax=Platysternon megacephalum TaxID=55544 RepID=A0A4D9EHB5_9SAUR|nr:NADH dehydrogenase [Platysternon megacephalum]